MNLTPLPKSGYDFMFFLSFYIGSNATIHLSVVCVYYNLHFLLFGALHLYSLIDMLIFSTSNANNNKICTSAGQMRALVFIKKVRKGFMALFCPDLTKCLKSHPHMYATFNVSDKKQRCQDFEIYILT
jgi:hypothetical protein